MSDTRPSWDEVWQQIAGTMAQRSRCSRAQVGAVIVSSEQRIVATGYNGAAASYRPAAVGMCQQWCPRAQGVDLDATYDSCPAIHAEENAIAYVDRSHINGGSIYVTAACCMKCAKLISASGIQRVVMKVREEDMHRQPEIVANYLKSCGITVEVV